METGIVTMDEEVQTCIRMGITTEHPTHQIQQTQEGIPMETGTVTMDEEVQSDVAVLTMHGVLANRPNLTPFHRRITRLIQNGVTHVVVDFSQVRWFGAAMLGWLICSQETLRQTGGDLRLVGLSKQSDRIMKMSRLFDRFKIFGTRAQAIASFRRRAMAHAA